MAEEGECREGHNGVCQLYVCHCHEESRNKVGIYLSYYNKAGDTNVELFKPTELFCAYSIQLFLESLFPGIDLYNLDTVHDLSNDFETLITEFHELGRGFSHEQRDCEDQDDNRSTERTNASPNGHAKDTKKKENRSSNLIGDTPRLVSEFNRL
jgi:hypothetical protein